jgi:hypothetical protein
LASTASAAVSQANTNAEGDWAFDEADESEWQHSKREVNMQLLDQQEVFRFHPLLSSSL